MIKILTDSASDIELDEAEKLGISLIPILIRFGNEEYLDGVNLSHRKFFERLIESKELPQTSQINEFAFNQKFEELTADGSDVIAVLLSSKLSGTYASAVKAAENFKGKVKVVDSLNACIGERVLVQYALKLAKQYSNADAIAEELNSAKGKIRLLALLDTLKYLRKGGRISSVAAVAGEMLSIKPVVAIERGEVKLVGKAMGSKKGNNLLTQLVDRFGGIDFSMPYALGYSGLSDEFLKKYLNDSEKLWKEHTDSVPSYMIGSTIVTHVGPDAIAVAFFSNN